MQQEQTEHSPELPPPRGFVQGLYVSFSPFTLWSLGLTQALAPCLGGTHVSASLAAATSWGGRGSGVWGTGEGTG